MTIIAVKDGVMAADSASFQGNVMFHAPEAKIVRAPDGGLIGVAGATGDCTILRRWACAGMDFDAPPKFSFTNVAEENSVLWLWLKPDGAVHMGDCTLNNWVVPGPVVIGCGAEYVYGLLDGGMSLPDAVRRAIGRVPWLGGDVQCETIDAAVVIPVGTKVTGCVMELPSGASPIDIFRTDRYL